MHRETGNITEVIAVANHNHGPQAEATCQSSQSRQMYSSFDRNGIRESTIQEREQQTDISDNNSTPNNSTPNNSTPNNSGGSPDLRDPRPAIHHVQLEAAKVNSSHIVTEVSSPKRQKLVDTVYSGDSSTSM
jgi:hypothetical protein